MTERGVPLYSHQLQQPPHSNLAMLDGTRPRAIRPALHHLLHSPAPE